MEATRKTETGASSNRPAPALHCYYKPTDWVNEIEKYSVYTQTHTQRNSAHARTATKSGAVGALTASEHGTINFRTYTTYSHTHLRMVAQ